MSKAFVGFIVVSLVGAAAEMTTAFSAARKNRLDLSVGIAMGSSAQIALFVAPVLIILSYFIAPTPMDLNFGAGQVLMVLLTTLTVTMVVGHRSIGLVLGSPAARGLRGLRGDALPDARLTGTDGQTTMASEQRRRVLEPTERFSEILFGLIMVLTFTGSLSVATSGREDVKAMIIGAIGCNLAWGIVDAIMYVMNSLAERGRSRRQLPEAPSRAGPGASAPGHRGRAAPRRRADLDGRRSSSPFASA